MMKISIASLRSAGFTVLELLIVIVVIGILASITIVSYNGVTQRTNNSSAEDAANTVARKLESFNSETGAFPYALSSLTGDSSKPYYIDPAAIDFNLSTTQPTKPATIKFIKCGVAPNSSQSTITSANNNIRGARIYYWTYTGGGNANSYIAAGNDVGSGVACPTS